MMKKLLLLLFLLPLTVLSQQTLTISSPVKVDYSDYFENAYQQFPDIPRGILEAVAYGNTHIYHITHAPGGEESCMGLPMAYGVMGLTLDGKGYFNNNLVYVSNLSGISTDDIISSPEQNILAYAAAFNSVMTTLKNQAGEEVKPDDIIFNTLLTLSELPQEDEGQLFAVYSQLYSYFWFMAQPEFQSNYRFPDHGFDLHTLFGEDNYRVLSSEHVEISDDNVVNSNGDVFKSTGGNSAPTVQSADYAPAIWNQAASCNFSSRSQAVTAVTIHDVEGSYASCISWFQNCNAGVSAHYVVRSSDGQVTQMVLESKKAWHVGTENGYTIGIEHEGYASQTGWYTNAMYQSSANLVKDICNSGYGIDPTTAYNGPSCACHSTQPGSITIKGHQHYPNTPKIDPGVNWDWGVYYNLINSTTTTCGTPSGLSANSIAPTSATLSWAAVTSANIYTIMYKKTTSSTWMMTTSATTSKAIMGLTPSTAYQFKVQATCAVTGSFSSLATFTTTLPSDNIAPITTINPVNGWQTTNFTATYSDIDNGGSGLEKSFYQVLDYNGTEWRSNGGNGFFADNFDNSIHPDWTSVNGTWSINSGSLYQSDENSSNTNIYAAVNQSLSNRYLYHFTAKFDGTDPNRRVGFHFMCDNASQSNRGNSYMIWFRLDDAQLEVIKVTNNVLGAAVVDIPYITVPGQLYDYKIIYDRITGKINIYRDDQFVVSWTDASPLSTGNAISFRTGNATIAVNELKVYRSRPASSVITVGSASTNDIRYQNPSPTTPSARIKSICMDATGNLSTIVSENVNVDWTAPGTVDTINDGNGIDINITSSLTDLSANWSSSTDANSNIAGYWYAIGTTSGGTDILNFTNNGLNQAVTEDSLNLVNGQTYYFSVKAENYAGLQSPVFTSNGQTVQVTSIDEKGLSNKLLAYPNPFGKNTSITYELSANSKVELTLTDVLGKELILYSAPNESAGKHEFLLNTDDFHLSNGLYFVKLVTNDQQNLLKIIVR